MQGWYDPRMRCALLLALGFLVSCGGTSSLTRTDETYSSADVLVAAADELARNGDPEADAALVAGGPDALPYVRPLISSPDPDVRERARLVVAAILPDAEMAPADRVDLILAAVIREGGAPHASLLAADRLRRIGAEARLPLESAASAGGERGRLARRLLLLVTEAP